MGPHFWACEYIVSNVGTERDGYQQVHPTAGSRRQTIGSDQPMALTVTSIVAPTSGAALATATSRSERLAI